MKDVQRTRDQLRLTFPLVPRPATQVIKDFDLSTNKFGISYGTVIIDKKGIVRFVHDSSNELEYPSVSEILRVLQKIR